MSTSRQILPETSDLTPSNVETLTNEQLRDALIKFGEAVGPVVDSTRFLYKRKLISLLKKPTNQRQVSKPNLSNPTTAAPRSALPKPINQPPPPPSPAQRKGNAEVIAMVTTMSNEDIRAAFKSYGKDPGPIVASTRHTYEKRLIKLRTHEVHQAGGQIYAFSSDDEDMDWLPV